MLPFLCHPIPGWNLKNKWMNKQFYNLMWKRCILMVFKSVCTQCYKREYFAVMAQITWYHWFSSEIFTYISSFNFDRSCIVVCKTRRNRKRHTKSHLHAEESKWYTLINDRASVYLCILEDPDDEHSMNGILALKGKGDR